MFFTDEKFFKDDYDLYSEFFYITGLINNDFFAIFIWD